MLVSTHGEYLRLVKQMDHAEVSGNFAKQLGNEYFERPHYFDSFCYAAANHDLGWKEPDEEILYDFKQARPLNFTEIHLGKHIEFYRKGVEQVTNVDKYAGILVGMHWTGLYTGRWGYLPQQRRPSFGQDEEQVDVDELIHSQEKLWVDLKETYWSSNQPRSEIDKKLWMEYELLQFLDRFSLFVCMADPYKQSQTQLGPIRNVNGERTDLTITSLGDCTVSVDPYPFHVNEFKVEVPIKNISQQSSKTHEQLVDTYKNSDIEYLKFTIIKK